MFSGMTTVCLFFTLIKNKFIVQMERFLVIYVLVAISFIDFISLLFYLVIKRQLKKFKSQLIEEAKQKETEKQITIDLDYRTKKIGIPNLILLSSNGLIIAAIELIT